MSTVANSATSPVRATISDLEKVEGKAELIDGRVVHYMPTGYLPNRVAFRIVPIPGRSRRRRLVAASFSPTVWVSPFRSSHRGGESFCPDAWLYYVGPHPENPMRFVKGAS